MKIRRAKLSDAVKISNLRKKTWREINGKDYPKKLIEALNKKNTAKETRRKIREREMFCLVDKNKILGIVNLDIKKKKIGGLFVKYNLIRRGYGGKLLNFIENRARKKGIKKVILYSTKYGYGFYLKNGYKFKRKDKNKIEGILATTYQMEKRLK